MYRDMLLYVQQGGGANTASTAYTDDASYTVNGGAGVRGSIPSGYNANLGGKKLSRFAYNPITSGGTLIVSTLGSVGQGALTNKDFINTLDIYGVGGNLSLKGADAAFTFVGTSGPYRHDWTWTGVGLSQFLGADATSNGTTVTLRFDLKIPMMKAATSGTKTGYQLTGPVGDLSNPIAGQSNINPTNIGPYKITECTYDSSTSKFTLTVDQTTGGRLCPSSLFETMTIPGVGAFKTSAAVYSNGTWTWDTTRITGFTAPTAGRQYQILTTGFSAPKSGTPGYSQRHGFYIHL